MGKCRADVSTRSRPKAAELRPQNRQSQPGFQHAAARRRLGNGLPFAQGVVVSTRSRPKAAAKRMVNINFDKLVSTRSRPKAAAYSAADLTRRGLVSTRSRPKAAAAIPAPSCLYGLFQHAAARRRLFFQKKMAFELISFNTQPPEGGWRACLKPRRSMTVSTRSRPKAAGKSLTAPNRHFRVSTRSRPKAAVVLCGNSKIQ